MIKAIVVQLAHWQRLGWAMLSFLTLGYAAQVLPQLVAASQTSANLMQSLSLLLISVLLIGCPVAARLYQIGCQTKEQVQSHWATKLGNLICAPMLLAATIIAVVLALQVMGRGSSAVGPDEPMFIWIATVLLGWRLVPSVLFGWRRRWLSAVADSAFGAALITLAIWGMILTLVPFWMVAAVFISGVTLLVAVTVSLLPSSYLQ